MSGPVRMEDLHGSGASDGDVPVWDDTAGLWVPTAPTSASALDDLTDVDTTGVADGDVLTYASGSSSWVPAAPSGGGGSALVNRALGLSYTLPNTPNATYPDAASDSYFDGTGWNGRKLTDGVWGGVYTGGQNVGWLATDGVVKFDLTTAANVEKVICRGRFGAGGVRRPISFKVEHSDDDVTYTTDFTVSGLAELETGGDRDWMADCPFTGSSHRYWKVTIGRSATASKFLFVNEVELWG